MEQTAKTVKPEHVATDPQATWDRMRELVSKALTTPKPIGASQNNKKRQNGLDSKPVPLSDRGRH